jgi:hypothetical protein
VSGDASSCGQCPREQNRISQFPGDGEGFLGLIDGLGRADPTVEHRPVRERSGADRGRYVGTDVTDGGFEPRQSLDNPPSLKPER